MAFVSVPKDLNKVKNKVLFNLTKRQLICLFVAASLGLPFYLMTKNVLGTSNAATGMVLIMLPAFMFAMYEKDGMSLERVLFNVLQVKLLNPGIRPYETENLYAVLSQDQTMMIEKKTGGLSVVSKEKGNKIKSEKNGTKKVSTKKHSLSRDGKRRDMSC